jgi:tRNA A-37 threonylcarbamoyl transferase component Bud32
MTEPPDDPVEVLFHQAAALPPGERMAFLDAACRGDAGLRAEVDDLLAHDGSASDIDGLLASPLLRGAEPARAEDVRGLADRAGTDPASDAGPSRSPESPPVPPPPAVEIPGYVILHRLGAGGMGVVYKARHVQLDRTVALKVIRSGDQASPAERARFHTEAQAAARLQHPNIVPVFEVGEAHGQPFLAMEYVEGTTLAKAITGTPWAGGQAARLVETLARAMAAAHRQGIIHRDLKPANVLLQISDCRLQIADGRFEICPLQSAIPKITDFGLAKMLASSQEQTDTGAFLGSPSYAAPEQAGAHKSAVGPHTDIYALGAVLYELLTGRPPFAGTTLLETIEQVLHRDPVPPRLINPSISQDLEAVCLMCLEKDPARRYLRAEDLAEDLRRWQHHEPTLARPPGALGRATRWCRRHPTWATIAALVGLGVVCMSWQWRAAVAAGQLAEERREAAVQAGDLAERRRQDAERARQDADRARQDAVGEAAVARDVANFLGGLFEEADPFVPTDRVLGEQPNTNPTARDIVNRSALRLANPDLFREKPLVRAALLDKVGHVYLSLGEGARAGPFLTEALELRRKHLPADHADLASSLHNVGFLQLAKGNHRKSVELLAAATDMRTRLFEARSPLAMTSRSLLATAKVALEDASAEPLLLEVLAFQRARFKDALARQPEAVDQRAVELDMTLITLCNFYARCDQALRALPYLLEAEQVANRVANKEFAALGHHFIAYRRFQAFGLVDRADQELVLALAAVEKRCGKRHFVYLALQRERAYSFYAHDRFQEAEAVFLDLETNTRQAAGDGLALADVSYEIARSIARGRFSQACQTGDQAQVRTQAARVEHYARAAYLGGKRNGEEAVRVGIYAVLLAHTLLSIRPEPDNATAEVLAREAVSIRTAAYGIGHALTSHPRAFLFLALARQNKVDVIEQTTLDLLARDPRPSWDANASDALPEAARKLALAGKTRTAVLLLEQVARAGHYDLDQVRSDPAFASLRDSAEYRQLLKKLASQEPARGQGE